MMTKEKVVPGEKADMAFCFLPALNSPTRLGSENTTNRRIKVGEADGNQTAGAELGMTKPSPGRRKPARHPPPTDRYISRRRNADLPFIWKGVRGSNLCLLQASHPTPSASGYTAACVCSPREHGREVGFGFGAQCAMSLLRSLGPGPAPPWASVS